MEYVRQALNDANNPWKSYVQGIPSQFPVFLLLAILEEKHRIRASFRYFQAEEMVPEELPVRHYFESNTSQDFLSDLTDNMKKVQFALLAHALLEQMNIERMEFRQVCELFGSLFDTKIHLGNTIATENEGSGINLHVMADDSNFYIYFLSPVPTGLQSDQARCQICGRATEIFPHPACKVCSYCVLAEHCPQCGKMFSQTEIDLLEAGLTGEARAALCTQCQQEYTVPDNYQPPLPTLCANCRGTSQPIVACKLCNCDLRLISVCDKGCVCCSDCLMRTFPRNVFTCKFCESTPLYFSINFKPRCCFSAKRQRLVKRGQHLCHIECRRNGRCSDCSAG